MYNRNVKIILTIILTTALMIVIGGHGNAGAEANTNMKNKSDLTVVSSVDVKRYMGRWYEIASILVWFQKDCAGGTSATYSINSNGTVSVLNQCVTKEGKVKKAKGSAWVVDKKTNAKLKVSFLPLGMKLFAGDYWIIDLAPDYEYAVVGNPSREYGWILSRKQELSPDTIKNIAARLESQGYDFSRFKMTNQKDYPKK